MDAIKQLEALAEVHEEIARNARAGIEALRKVYAGEVAPAVSKPKKYVSPETREKLRQKVTASWARRKKQVA